MGCDPIEGGGCASCAKASFQLQMQQQIQQEKLVSEKSESRWKWAITWWWRYYEFLKRNDSYGGQTKYLCDQKMKLEFNFLVNHDSICYIVGWCKRSASLPVTADAANGQEKWVSKESWSGWMIAKKGEWCITEQDKRTSYHICSENELNISLYIPQNGSCCWSIKGANLLSLRTSNGWRRIWKKATNEPKEQMKQSKRRLGKQEIKQMSQTQWMSQTPFQME